jgi:hypothetical protein
MRVKENQTYKTPAGLLLRVKTIGQSGTHILEHIDKKGNIVPEKRNKRGHVITRNIRVCSEETIRSFKKAK